MDLDIREAERRGDYQQVYTLLRRAGRDEEANDLIKDHPIQIVCNLLYKYLCYVNSVWPDNSWGTDTIKLSSSTLTELITNFINLNISAACISHIIRTPIVVINDTELLLNASDLWPEFKLKMIQFSQEEIQKIKTQIRAHPSYLHKAKDINTERLNDASDIARSQKLIDHEKVHEQKALQKLKLKEKYETDSQILYQDSCLLWDEHFNLSRKEFAQLILSNNQIWCKTFLFRLKSLHDSNVEITYSMLQTVWDGLSDIRYSDWKKHQNSLDSTVV